MVGTYNFPNVQTGFSALANGMGSAVSKITAQDNAAKEQQFRDALATAMLHITQQKWEAEQEDDGRGGGNSTVTPGVAPTSAPSSFGNQTQSGGGAMAAGEAAPTPHLSLMGGQPTDVASAAQQVRSLRQNVAKVLFKGGNGLPEVDDVLPLLPRTGLPLSEQFKREDAETSYGQQLNLDKYTQGEEDSRQAAALQNARDIAEGNNRTTLAAAQTRARATTAAQARSDRNSQVASLHAIITEAGARARAIVAAKEHAQANFATPEQLQQYDVALQDPMYTIKMAQHRLEALGGVTKDDMDAGNVQPQGAASGTLPPVVVQGRNPISQQLYDALRAMGKTDADIEGANGGDVAFTIPPTIKRH